MRLGLRFGLGNRLRLRHRFGLGFRLRLRFWLRFRLWFRLSGGAFGFAELGHEQLAPGHAVTAGGRVLTVCALGHDIAAARERAYAAVRQIRYDGAFCRRDIAYRALRRS